MDDRAGVDSLKPGKIGSQMAVKSENSPFKHVLKRRRHAYVKCIISYSGCDLAPTSPTVHETVMKWARSVLNHIQ
jgi:hypothetical protein